MSISVSGKKIVFLGAGNVATHLARAFDKVDGIDVVQVYSRSLESASVLSESLSHASATDCIEDICTCADLYIVSLVDDAVAGVLASVPHGNALWVHTSGSLPKEVLSAVSSRHGVLYPLQTFSKDVEVDMAEVPIFVEGSTPDVEEDIRAFAGKISDRVYQADGERRRKMHVAAVFACNFVNYFWTVADDLLKEEGLGLEVLHPLMRETMRKAIFASPSSGQTGPAVRGDRKVIAMHSSMLPSKFADIYTTMSDMIYDHYHNHEQN